MPELPRSGHIPLQPTQAPGADPGASAQLPSARAAQAGAFRAEAAHLTHRLALQEQYQNRVDAEMQGDRITQDYYKKYQLWASEYLSSNPPTDSIIPAAQTQLDQSMKDALKEASSVNAMAAGRVQHQLGRLLGEHLMDKIVAEKNRRWMGDKRVLQEQWQNDLVKSVEDGDMVVSKAMMQFNERDASVGNSIYHSGERSTNQNDMLKRLQEAPYRGLARRKPEEFLDNAYKGKYEGLLDEATTADLIQKAETNASIQFAKTKRMQEAIDRTRKQAEDVLGGELISKAISSAGGIAQDLDQLGRGEVPPGFVDTLRERGVDPSVLHGLPRAELSSLESLDRTIQEAKYRNDKREDKDIAFDLRWRADSWDGRGAIPISRSELKQALDLNQINILTFQHVSSTLHARHTEEKRSERTTERDAISQQRRVVADYFRFAGGPLERMDPQATPYRAAAMLEAKRRYQTLYKTDPLVDPEAIAVQVVTEKLLQMKKADIDAIGPGVVVGAMKYQSFEQIAAAHKSGELDEMTARLFEKALLAKQAWDDYGRSLKVDALLEPKGTTTPSSTVNEPSLEEIKKRKPR